MLSRATTTTIWRHSFSSSLPDTQMVCLRRGLKSQSLVHAASGRDFSSSLLLLEHILPSSNIHQAMFPRLPIDEYGRALSPRPFSPAVNRLSSIFLCLWFPPIVSSTKQQCPKIRRSVFTCFVRLASVCFCFDLAIIQYIDRELGCFAQ